MKSALRVAGLVCVLALVGACASNPGDAAMGEAPAETVAEEIIEFSDDPVDLPADDSVMEFSNVPEGWPEEIPVPVGGALEAWSQPFDNQFKATWRIEEVDVTGVDFVYDNLLMDAGSAYNEALAQLDWMESEYSATETSGEGSYSSPERTVNFQATPTADGAVSIYVEVELGQS